MLMEAEIVLFRFPSYKSTSARCSHCRWGSGRQVGCCVVANILSRRERCRGDSASATSRRAPRAHPPAPSIYQRGVRCQSNVNRLLLRVTAPPLQAQTLPPSQPPPPPLLLLLLLHFAARTVSSPENAPGTHHEGFSPFKHKVSVVSHEKYFW